jgi:hypothetical protein
VKEWVHILAGKAPKEAELAETLMPAKPGQAGSQPVLAPEAGRRLATPLSELSRPKYTITHDGAAALK